MTSKNDYYYDAHWFGQIKLISHMPGAFQLVSIFHKELSDDVIQAMSRNALHCPNFFEFHSSPTQQRMPQRNDYYLDAHWFGFWTNKSMALMPCAFQLVFTIFISQATVRLRRTGYVKIRVSSPNSFSSPKQQRIPPKIYYRPRRALISN